MNTKWQPVTPSESHDQQEAGIPYSLTPAEKDAAVLGTLHLEMERRMKNAASFHANYDGLVTAYLKPSDLTAKERAAWRVAAMSDLSNMPINAWKTPLGEMRTEQNDGMTLRQHYAGLAMQGMAMRSQVLFDHEIASLSVKLADALIAELEKPQ